MTLAQPTTNDPTRLGSVEDVDGSTIRVKLPDNTAHGMIFVDGEGYRVGQVGSFVRIPSGYLDLYGLVSQVGAGAAPGPEELAPQLGNRWLRVELVGEGRRGVGFDRGISQFPSIGDPVHVVTEADLHTVYAPGNTEAYVTIGRVASAQSIPAYVDLNHLVSRHSAIVGSTGAGKSTAVASLVATLSDPARYPAARVVLLDLHGEYGTAFGDRAKVFRISPKDNGKQAELYVPFWALTGEELIALTFGGVPSGLLSPLIEQMVNLKRDARPGRLAHGVRASDVTMDTPIPFCIHKLWLDMFILHTANHTVSSNQNQHEATIAWAEDPETQTPIKGDALTVTRPQFRPQRNVADDPDKVYKGALADKPRSHIDTLEGKLRDPRLQFLFQPGDWSVKETGESERDLDSLLQTWLGHDAPISVFDLSGVPSDVLDDLVGALLRILFDAVFWGRTLPVGGRHRPLLIVLEEAHQYLGTKDRTSDLSGKGRAAKAARRIAKEGRKYGAGLMLVSQRPSEIDSTILSQCGTLISLRLTNDSDRNQVTAAASDNLKGLFSMLPILRTGEALIVGEAVNLPIRALIELPPEGHRPDSEDPLVVVPRGPDGMRKQTGGWTERIADENYKPLVKGWRMQDPNAGANKTPPKKG